MTRQKRQRGPELPGQIPSDRRQPGRDPGDHGLEARPGQIAQWSQRQQSDVAIKDLLHGDLPETDDAVFEPEIDRPVGALEFQ